jgi:hypothetical protein
MNWSALQKRVLFSVVAVTLLAGSMCNGSSVVGTYSNANGFVTMDVRSGGQASVTMMGETKTCTYKVDGGQLTLNCPETDPIVLTIHDDGSMTPPPGNFIGTLKKSKS